MKFGEVETIDTHNVINFLCLWQKHELALQIDVRKSLGSMPQNKLASETVTALGILSGISCANENRKFICTA